MSDKVKEILKQLAVASQREMGTAWCTQMINDIDRLDAKEIKKIRSSDRMRDTRFTDNGSGDCIHCGYRSGTHLYSTERCPK